MKLGRAALRSVAGKENKEMQGRTFLFLFVLLAFLFSPLVVSHGQNGVLQGSFKDCADIRDSLSVGIVPTPGGDWAVAASTFYAQGYTCVDASNPGAWLVPSNTINTTCNSGLSSNGCLFSNSNPFTGSGTSNSVQLNLGCYDYVISQSWITPRAPTTLNVCRSTGSAGNATHPNGTNIHLCSDSSATTGCGGHTSLLTGNFPSFELTASNYWPDGDPNAPSMACWTTGASWGAHFCTGGTTGSSVTMTFAMSPSVTVTASSAFFTAAMVGGIISNCDSTNIATMSCNGVAHIIGICGSPPCTTATIDGSWGGTAASGVSEWTVQGPNVRPAIVNAALGSTALSKGGGFAHYIGPISIDLADISESLGLLSPQVCQEGCVYDGLTVDGNYNAQTNNESGKDVFACASFDRSFRPGTGGGHWAFGTPTPPRCTTDLVNSGTMNGWTVELYSIYQGISSTGPEAWNGGTKQGRGSTPGPQALFKNAESWDGVTQFSNCVEPSHSEFVSGNAIDIGQTNAVTGMNICGTEHSNTLGGSVVHIHSSTNGMTTGTIVDNVQALSSNTLIQNDNNAVQNVVGTTYQHWEQSGSTAQFGSVAATNIGGLLTNDGTTGTTINELVSLTSAGNAIRTSAGATSGVQGVAVSGAGTSGTVQIAYSGQASVIADNTTTVGHYAVISPSQNGEVTDTGASTCPASGQVIGRFLTANAGAGTAASVLLGSDCPPAPSGVAILKKTTSYAGVSGDFSSPTTAPTQIIFTLTTTGQAYTTPSSLPQSGSCVVVENSLASAPYVLGVVTGGSTTLDGTAYTTIGSSLSLSPGQSEWICSDISNNYYSQQGMGVPSSMSANKGGILVPYESGTAQTGGTTANTPVCTVFNLYKRQLVTNITYDYTIGQLSSTGDWGIYDINGNRLTHTGSQSTSSGTGAIVKVMASPVITLPPGQYQACACNSSPAVSIEGFAVSVLNQQITVASGSTIGNGTGSSCTAGVLPTTSTLSPSSSPTVAPLLLLTP